MTLFLYGFIAGVLALTVLWRVLIALASHWWPAPEDDERSRVWSKDDAAMRGG
jgi:hypothetical protein